MLWVKAFHIIFMVAWFSGLFYLPRLFVYHAMSADRVSIERFKLMERRLYYVITFPAALLTTAFGIWLLSGSYNYFLSQNWMLFKLILVIVLWAYHIYCGKLLLDFAHDRNHHSAIFYRYFNEVPTVLLFLIVILAVVHP